MATIYNKQGDDMKRAITVNNKQEGEAIEKALGNPVTRAIVTIEGVLAKLTQEQQTRVLRFVQESLSGAGGE